MSIFDYPQRPSLARRLLQSKWLSGLVGVAISIMQVWYIGKCTVWPIVLFALILIWFPGTFSRYRLWETRMDPGPTVVVALAGWLLLISPLIVLLVTGDMVIRLR